MSSLDEYLDAHCQMFAENKAIMLLIDSGDGAIVCASLGACNFYGYSKSELTSMFINKINTCTDNNTAGIFQNTNRDDENYFRCTHSLASGEIRQVEVFTNTISINHNNFIYAVIHDLTELDQLKTAHQERVDIYQAAINTSVLGFWVIDMEGNFLDTNNAYLKQSGYTREELLSMNIPSIEASMTGEEVAEKIKLVTATGFSRFRTRHRKKDGTEWPAEIVTTFSEIQGGRFFVFIEDISEKVKSEQKILHYQNHLEELVQERTAELEYARYEAEKANRAKSDFLSSMSHELRTPLNAILGFSQLLNLSNDLSEDDKESVDEILIAGEHLLKLISEVLDLAKIESGQISISKEPVEISPLIEECLSLVKPQANKRNIVISYGKLEKQVVQADRTRLKQALLNLLSNAIKYNRDNGTIEITSCNIDDQKIKISVSDTGKGIPRERLNELFQPFNRLNAEKSSIEGTGIGLTLTQKIINLMDGSIEVESKVDIGSTFHVILPTTSLQQLTDDRLHNKNEKQSKNTYLKKENKTYTVLYVEDNPANLRLVAQILKRHKNIHMISAHNAELGLEIATYNKPDLIFLDINLPGMDGYQLLKLLKKMEKYRNTEIVAITANAMDKDIERGFSEGFSEYLTKPINIDKFNDILNKLLFYSK